MNIFKATVVTLDDGVADMIDKWAIKTGVICTDRGEEGWSALLSSTNIGMVINLKPNSRSSESYAFSTSIKNSDTFVAIACYTALGMLFSANDEEMVTYVGRFISACAREESEEVLACCERGVELLSGILVKRGQDPVSALDIVQEILQDIELL